MVRSYQTLGAIRRNGRPEGAKPGTDLISLTEQVHTPKMAKTEKHCWWMRRKEIDASTLSEEFKEKQPPTSPFLSFCGLTIAKCSCAKGVCPVCRIGNATSSSQLEKQVTLKSSRTCHRRISMGLNHYRTKQVLAGATAVLQADWKARHGWEPQPSTATLIPPLLGQGNVVPSSYNVRAHQCPYGPSTTPTTNRCCEEGERSRVCVEPDLLVLPVLVQRVGAPARHTELLSGQPLLAQNALQLFPCFPPHTLNSLFCVLHTP